MKFRAQWTWMAGSLVVIGMLLVGVVLLGCSGSPEAEPKTKVTASEESVNPEKTTEPEESAKPEETTEPAESTGPEQATPPEETTVPAESPATEASPIVKVSSFAPAEDLVAQVVYYVVRLDEAVESEEAYNEFQERISKDANTLIVIALGLGLHDEDNPYKASAGTLLKAAQDLAAARDFAAAKAAVTAVKAAAAGGQPSAVELRWEKVAALGQLMKQVPLINTKLKGCVRRLQRKGKQGQGHSAVIAMIAQGTMADTHEATNADEVAQWQQFSAGMRDAAAAVNRAIRARDKDATAAAMQKLAQTCEDCHAVFHEEALELLAP